MDSTNKISSQKDRKCIKNENIFHFLARASHNQPRTRTMSMASVNGDFFVAPSTVLLSPSQQDILDLNEALMKSIKASPVMNTSSLDIISDKTLSDKTKQAMLTNSLKMLRMQQDMLLGRIEETRHELRLINQETVELLTETV